MSNEPRLDFPMLDSTGSEYHGWVTDVENHLTARGILPIIQALREQETNLAEDEDINLAEDEDINLAEDEDGEDITLTIEDFKAADKEHEDAADFD
ncbi:hypothetical protein ABKV19_025461 [Rosa sericea]